MRLRLTSGASLAPGLFSQDIYINSEDYIDKIPPGRDQGISYSKAKNAWSCTKWDYIRFTYQLSKIQPGEGCENKILSKESTTTTLFNADEQRAECLLKQYLNVWYWEWVVDHFFVVVYISFSDQESMHSKLIKVLETSFGNIQNGTKVALQLWVGKTQFILIWLLIIILFSMNNYKPTMAPHVCVYNLHR